MTEKAYIGIDNGTSGSIGIIYSSRTPTFVQVKTFTHLEQDYTKKKKKITRLDVPVLTEWLNSQIKGHECKALLERPMVNPKFFNTTMTAMRIWESELNILEMLKIGYEPIDSKEWQKILLPKGVKGPELKPASREVGIKMFPNMRDVIERQKDADGLLIAEYCRRKYNTGE